MSLPRAFRSVAFAVVIGMLSVPNVIAQQLPRGSWIRYTSLRVALAPDTSGVYLWASSGAAPGVPGRAYQASFDPSEILNWVSDARWFLEQKLSPSDTAITRSSAALRGLDSAGRIYLVRRRDGANWTNDRYLIFEPKDPGAEPIIVNAFEQEIRRILDSAEVVSRRAPPFRPDTLRDSTGAIIHFDLPARLKPGQHPPVYPGNARMNGEEGLVVVRFVIGVDGKADMRTTRVIMSAGDEFEKSVLSTLKNLRFEPARRNGSPVRQLVVMPFDFSFYRR